MANFLLPSLGADMTEGTLVAWRVKPGDIVTRGQVVAEVETDKGIIDVECFLSGVVEQLIAEPGQKQPVGAVLAVIRGEQEPPPAAPAEISPTPTAAALPSAASPSEKPAERTARPRVKATPAARRRAVELGVELETLQETKPGGVIELADVELAAATTPAAAPPPTETRERMRRAIAAAMAKSKREIPHYYLATRMNLKRALDWLEAENLRRPIAERLLPAVLLLKAVALALRDVPELNGFWIDGASRPSQDIHLGFAIAMKGGGLVAPAIHHTDRKSLDELMACLHDLIPRARAGRLRSSEMTDATLTLTNLGDLGVESLCGVIYPPQVALVGFGKILRQPWVEADDLVIRPVLTATLAADHRATDGLCGARFLEALDRRLQTPEQL